MRQPWKALSYFIVGLHIFVFCCFVFGSYLPKKRTHRIAVHAVRLKPPPAQTPKPIATKPQAKASAAIPQSEPSKAQTNSQPVASKPKQKVASSKTSAKKKKEPEATATKPKEATKDIKKVKKSNVVSDKIRKELEESIAKIDQKHDNFREKKATSKARQQELVPLVLSSLEQGPIIGSSTSSLEDIKELLVQELKNSLNLPDFGEVTMRLVLRQDGSIAEVKVLKSGSKKNSEYLERELPKHSFPFLSSYGLKEKERTFVITFCNEL